MQVNSTNNISLNSVKYIFNGDFFAVKIFTNLLNAIINDTLDDTTNELDTEVIYNYLLIRPIVDKFFEDTIYESLYKSDMYDGLITALEDLYSCLYTIVYMRRNINDVDIQPEEFINDRLNSFGFPSLSLFDSIQKREIARNVYGFLRMKGTPSLIRRLLLQLGFSYFFITEFWLNKNDNGDYVALPEIVTESSSFDSTANWDMFLKNKSYTLAEIRAMDPLWISESSDLDTMETYDAFTLPAKLPYFQFGVASSVSDDEKLASSLIYATAKKGIYEMVMGDYQSDILYPRYTASKITFLDLLYAWSMIGEYYAPVYDIFGLNNTSNGTTYDVDGKYRHYDMEMAYDTISQNSIVERDFDDTTTDFDNKEIITQFDSYITNKYLTENVFGWNGDVRYESLGNILKDVNDLYSSTYTQIKYHPSIITYDDSQNVVYVNNNQKRKNDVDEITQTMFLSPSLFGDYDEVINTFKTSNLAFYTWLKALLESVTTSEDKQSLYVDLLLDILTCIENYIFVKSNVKLNLKQTLISSKEFNNISKEICKSFAPYHAKMIEPYYVNIIRDLPYDQILIADMDYKSPSTGMQLRSRPNMREAFWRAEYQLIFDIPTPEQYADGFDWYQHHEFVGYDHTKTIIVNGKEYAPKFDFESDYVKCGNSSLLTYSGWKTKLNPQKYETNDKMSFIVEVSTNGTEYNIYGKNGTDITQPIKILKLLPKSQIKFKTNLIKVDESFHNQYNDEQEYLRTLPNSNCSRDLNTYDDPRWNDRLDLIHISEYNNVELSSDVVSVGAVLVQDVEISVGGGRE